MARESWPRQNFNKIMRRILAVFFLLMFSGLAFSAPVDTDDIMPLKGPVDIKEGLSLWPFIALILLFIIAGSIFFYFKRKKGIKEVPVLPTKSPDETALEELEKLLGMRLAERGLIKEYYIRLSDIIRSYLEDRFSICALDRTTWELYQEMRSRKIERAHVEKIIDFLEGCDLVKFAKYLPMQKEIEGAHKKAEEIIEITKSGTL